MSISAIQTINDNRMSKLHALNSCYMLQKFCIRIVKMQCNRKAYENSNPLWLIGIKISLKYIKCNGAKTQSPYTQKHIFGMNGISNSITRRNKSKVDYNIRTEMSFNTF